ncbi:MAG: 50S ribosome-binding GTPase [Paludibacteraceae bacterium]|nr:50S ribosome-binding GTPase [Paludibacteraceae bacterium]
MTTKRIVREKTINKKKIRVNVVHRYRSDKLSRLEYFESLRNQKEQITKKISNNKLFSWREYSGLPRTIYCTNILFVGQTGTGKSSTLNHLLNDDYMATSDYESCTKTVNSSEVYIGKECYISFCDMPGIGENQEADKHYLELYSRMTEKSDVIVYLLSADKRDYAIDLKEFRSLKRRYSKKIFIGLNGIDKIEPISRVAEWTGPTEAQQINIERKVEDIRKLFRVKKDDIIPFSAICDYKLEDIARKITDTLLINMQSGIVKKIHF